MIPVEDAQEIIVHNVVVSDAERVPLAEAFGRILRQPIRADMDLPPFDRAMMDGYAVRAEDTVRAPVRLRVVGELLAGMTFSGAIAPGEAVKIMTGAVVPPGANAVERVEKTEREGEWVILREPVRPGQHITPRGSQAREGEIVLEPGIRIGPAEMAVLASFGYAEVQVARQLIFGVLSTGSELVAADARPSLGQIRDSNGPTLRACLAMAGVVGDPLGIVPDDLALIERSLRSALQPCDGVIITGGVSMGEADLVKTALRQMGARIFFERVRLHPGKPFCFATYEGKPIFALPGNPVSVVVTFLLFVLPALRRMLGCREERLPLIEATVTEDAKHSTERRSYLPAFVWFSEGQAFARRVPWEGSSDLVGFARANALLVVPEGVASVSAGERARVLLLPWREPR
ncbi:Molybdopterin molybdenumtransferase [bacterium HR08]|nr:Molybdopterin molybdenumtransferase [bacterium HR08]